MNVLYLVPYIPTLIRTRPYNLLRHLVRRGHRVTLATLWTNADERAGLLELETDGVQILAEPILSLRSLWNCLQALPRSVPFQALFSWQPSLARNLVSQLWKDGQFFDLVHVEHLRGAQYGVYLKAELSRLNGSGPGQRPRIPIIWDSVDCISFLFEQAARVSRNSFGRFATRLELPRTRQHEAWLLGQFDHTLVTSEKDRQAFVELRRVFNLHDSDQRSVGDRITVLRNGVDLSYFMPIKKPRDTRTIILTGKMGYHANITAALYLVNEVMPRVWEHIPDVRVQIVGYKPSREVMNLARQCPQRVQVTGGVADLRPYLAQATVSVAPILYGAGIQNKVLEAMAMATPVVATSTAVSALSVRDEDEVLIADDSEAFAHQIVRLLHTPSLCERIGQNGRRYVELNHDWNRIAEQLEEIYAATIATCVRNC